MREKESPMLMHSSYGTTVIVRAICVSGNGYVRSESVVSIFIQKHKDSKRVYAQVIHSKTNADGAKEDGKSKAMTNQLVIDSTT